ncbi:MAG: YchJ family protein [Acidihalobacter sp.]|jgi:SEC-C motif domain protein
MAKKSGARNAVDGCPCGSGRAYAQCCGRYVDGGELPDTAEQLMRSRYTAYTLAREDYLLATWHVSTRPPSLGFEPAQQWLGLKIVRTEAGGATDAEGRVAFVARSKLGGRAQRLEEDSRFVKEGGRWYYVDGRY